MTPLLQGWPTKAKETLCPHEVGLAPLDTNPVFQSLGAKHSMIIMIIMIIMKTLYEECCL